MCGTVEGAQHMQHDTVLFVLDAGMYIRTGTYGMMSLCMYVCIG